ncbi:hypothetical protein N9J72_02420 [Candidatus Gracilibacteria bacterium]|nr:hypothetical protein [Candidatus Gracilibacteria bacterium]
MRDSYKRFFKHFNIEFNQVIQFGIHEDTIFPKNKILRKVWNEHIYKVLHNEVAYIRGYGRDAHGTELYIELFELLLGNQNIKKDPTNNSQPRKVLENVTGYYKSGKNKQCIQNYQVSHIFGKTKNPFLFVAPWNIVWKPKILDPFTGHESKGEYSELYQREFQKKARELYKDFIEEYNILVEKYFSNIKIDLALSKMEKIHHENKLFNRFASDARKELTKIVI